MIVNKDAKIIQWGKKAFYQMILGQLGISCKGIKLDSPKTKPNMDQKKRTRLKPHKYKTFRGDITHDPERGGAFVRYDTKSTSKGKADWASYESVSLVL